MKLLEEKQRITELKDTWEKTQRLSNAMGLKGLSNEANQEIAKLNRALNILEIKIKK